jgi:hypothetical protein
MDILAHVHHQAIGRDFVVSPVQEVGFSACTNQSKLFDQFPFCVQLHAYFP